MNDKFVCAKCGREGEYDELPQAKDILSRLEIGDTFTDVECLACGALCYPEEVRLMSIATIELKTYHVDVDRTSVRTKLFEVKAFDENEAIDKAYMLAENYDFNACSENGAEYEVTNIEEQD